jgi:hypothetical protein
VPARDFTISINGAEKPTLAVVLEARTGAIRWITRVVGVPGMARVDEDPLLSAVLKTTDPPLWRLSNVWDSGARKDAEAVLSFERSVHLHIAVVTVR